MKVQTPAEHAVAMERLSVLMDADLAPESSESDELLRLADLIEAYEAKAHPIDLPSSLDAQQFRKEQEESYD